MVGAVMVVKLFVGWNFIKIEKTKQETKKTNKEEHKQNECGTLYTRLNIFFSNYNNMEEFTFFYLLPNFLSLLRSATLLVLLLRSTRTTIIRFLFLRLGFIFIGGILLIFSWFFFCSSPVDSTLIC